MKANIALRMGDHQYLTETFSTEGECRDFCHLENLKIIEEDYKGDSEAWRNDGNALEWMSVNQEELKDFVGE